MNTERAFVEVAVDGWTVTYWSADEIDIEPDLDRLLDASDEPLDRLRETEARERVRALAEEALSRPAYRPDGTALMKSGSCERTRSRRSGSAANQQARR